VCLEGVVIGLERVLKGSDGAAKCHICFKIKVTNVENVSRSHKKVVWDGESFSSEHGQHFSFVTRNGWTIVVSST